MSETSNALQNVISAMGRADAWRMLTPEDYYSSYQDKDVYSFSLLTKSKVNAVTGVQDNTLQYKFLLPLLNKETINISLEDSKKLTVKATYFDIVADKELYFEEVYTVPSKYSVDYNAEVKANYKDGVLYISIPLVAKKVVDVKLY